MVTFSVVVAISLLVVAVALGVLRALIGHSTVSTLSGVWHFFSLLVICIAVGLALIRLAIIASVVTIVAVFIVVVLATTVLFLAFVIVVSEVMVLVVALSLISGFGRNWLLVLLWFIVFVIEVSLLHLSLRVHFFLSERVEVQDEGSDFHLAKLGRALLSIHVDEVVFQSLLALDSSVSNLTNLVTVELFPPRPVELLVKVDD